MWFVDADTFLKSVKQKAYPQSGIVNESERKISLFGIMEILTAMPTPDVVEVVHGEWIPHEIQIAWGDGTTSVSLFKCSNCGYEQDGIDKYCSCCGAKMDERREQ